MTPPGRDAGHDEVFAEVLRQQGFVRSFAASCGVPGNLLDDCVQDVVFTAWRAIVQGRFQPVDPRRPLHASVRAWLCGIVKYRAKDILRAARAREQVLVPESDVDKQAIYAIIAPAGPEDRLIAQETLAVLAGVKLPTMARQVVDLAVQGHTLEQIATRLGIPPDTAWTHLRRARMAYRQAIKRQG